MSISCRPLRRLLRIVAASLMVSASSAALSQPAPPDGPPGQQRPDGRPRPMMQVFEEYGQLLRDLDLNDDQLKHCREAIRTGVESLRATARDSQTLPPEERLAGFREALDAINADISTTLNDEQKKAFDTRTAEIRTKAEASLRQGGRPGGDRPTSRPATQPGRRGSGVQQMGERAIDRVDRALEAVGLSDEQKAKFAPILKEAREKAAAVIAEAKASGNEDFQAMRAKFREIADVVRDKAREILSAEQIEKFREAMQPPNGGGGGGNRPPPGPDDNGDGGGMGGKDNPPPPPPGDKPAAAAPPATPPANASPAKTSTATPEAGTAGLAASSAAVTRPVAIGDPMPTFELTKVDGRPIATKSLITKPAVLIFGSLSAPSFRDRAAALNQLAKRYSSRARFIIIYTREQHPIGGDEPERNRDDRIAIAAHTTSAARLAAAKAARAQLDLTFEMAPDTMDDGLSQQLDAFPNGAVVFDGTGTLVERQRWVEPFALERELDRVLARK